MRTLSGWLMRASTKLIWMVGAQSPVPKGWQIHHNNSEKDVHVNSFDKLLCLHPTDHRKVHDDWGDVDDVPF